MVRKKSMKAKSQLNRVKAILKNTTISIQKIQAWITENKASGVGRKDPKQGFLRGTFNIKKFSNSKEEVFGCLQGKDKKEQVLGASLFLETSSSTISYDVDLTIRLVGVKSTEKRTNKCSNIDSELGFADLVAWTRLTNFTNGFVDDKGNFGIEALFSVVHKTNTNAPLDAQFLTSGYVKPDCTLLVENRQFPVNKGFLSSFSSYFKTLFFGDFHEKNQDQIELKGVCAAEFIHLLEIIYPSVDIEAGNESMIRKTWSVCCVYQIVTKPEL